MDAMLQDFRYAFRRLRHAPGFTFVVVVTLALGIGANSAIFSVINTVLLAPLPYRDPGQLVTIYHLYQSKGMEAPVSAPGFRDYRDRTHSFSNVGVESGWRVNYTGTADPEQLGGVKVTGDLFKTFGVAPLLGRTINNDDEATHAHVVVISHGLWQRDFGARLDAIGQSIVLNGEGYQIIGVMPATFVDAFAPPTDVWAPMMFTPDQMAASNYTNEYLSLAARLKPGVTVASAAAEMTALARTLRHDNPDAFSKDWTLQLVPMNDVQSGKIRPALLLLLGAVGFVLLIACTNVANLLLVRAASRQREIAIRTALGAKMSQLIRQMLAESLLLSLAGATLGLGLAWLCIRAIAAAPIATLPRHDALAIDGHVIWFTFALALVTGIAFGLVPAFQLRRANLQGTLRENSRGGTADQKSQLIRRVLVVVEVALALTLLTGGGLLVKSFGRVAEISPGFNASHLLTFGVALPAAKYPSDTARAALWASLLPRIAGVPGVQAAGGTSVVPFGGNWSTGSYNVDGYVVPTGADGPWGDIRSITPDYFHTMQIPLRRGRAFAAQDDMHQHPVAVVDDEFARAYFPAGTDVIGKRLYFGSATPDSTTRYITIVGMVAHAKHEGLDAVARPQLYLPVAQGINSVNRLDIVVRTTGEPLATVAAIRTAIHAVDRDLPISQVTTLDDLISASMGQRRLSAILTGVFAGLALLLASLGIYGVMSYAVAQRTRELGVRVALGATRENVLRLVLGQGLAITAIGTVVGLVGALALTRVIASQLYSVTATDPGTFALVTATLLIVATVACLIPALRATRIDPMVALREE